MQVLKATIAILTACLLQACSTSSTVSNQGDKQDSVNASLDQPSTIKAQTFILRGSVVVGHDTKTLTPCSSNQQYLLSMPETLSQQLMELSKTPYQPMYGEMVGYLAPPSKNGYKGDYSAKFIVTEMNMVSTEKTKGCDNPYTSTTAFGIKPAWEMSFTAKGLTFLPMGGKPQTTALTNSSIASTQRHYRFKGGDLTLQHQICSSGTSDSLYGWEAELTLADNRYQGCAKLGNSDPTLTWARGYFATSTQNSGFSINLTLARDHTAITRYTYNNGDPDIVEKGYWQQLNTDQVQVVMTRHQQQYLISERIFTKQGNRLIAEKEKVGNIVYPIANGGLVLFTNNQ